MLMLTGGVCRCIPSLVVTMEGDVQAEVFSQIVVVTVPEHVDIVAYRALA